MLIPLLLAIWGILWCTHHFANTCPINFQYPWWNSFCSHVMVHPTNLRHPMLHPTILLIIICVGSVLKETHIMHLILFFSSMKNILKMEKSRSKKEYSMILRVVELIEVVTIKIGDIQYLPKVARYATQHYAYGLIFEA